MNKFSIDGKELAYLDKGEGPVVLLGHSYLWDHKMWQPQIEALSENYRCIVPDLWAHGQSAYAPERVRSLKDIAADMLALMNHLDVEQFSVVGLSVGGMWGAELTLLAPERVKSLVMMDTFVGLEPEITHQKYFSMLDTIANVQMVPEPILEAVVPMFFAKNGAEKSPELVASFAKHLSSITGEQAVEVARIGRMIFGRRDMIEDIEKFALPVLIAVGQEDIPRPVMESYLMQDCITESQLVEIPQAGHISNLEQPDIVTSMLKEFLSKYA
ncbi:alpha/beta fold hydrolase [Vibrio marisflavi]|uniref:3-oxoadipate enol-lactonase 2 n=1 Tax=Vibrio marisflavi CECT 7928 TaxID=634439 RepID=A0ABN8DXP6_9VIBR|nr:alpha/beta hydrolase [Vibrio marisflavi]CAH0536361.1 3-oxoadipate enol-lactonase 2 [Vibrio marisflavi CECT 7928]